MLVFHAYHRAWLSWYMLLLTAALPIFSLLCSLPAILGLKLRAEMPRRCGKGAPVRFSLRAESRFPAPECTAAVSVFQQMDGSRSRVKLRFRGGRRGVDMPTAHCGAVSCAVSKVRAYDYLGLFALPVKAPEEMWLLTEARETAPVKEPDMSFLRRQIWKPKAGGGFSELHENREYRPGDPLRDIHWKLSAKTDKLIVREAQEAEKEKIAVTVDLPLPRESCDRALGELMWLSGRLLELGAEHDVYWLGSGGELKSWTVKCAGDRQEMMDRLLRSGKAGGESLRERSFAFSLRRFHIGGEEAGE